MRPAPGALRALWITGTALAALTASGCSGTAPAAASEPASAPPHAASSSAEPSSTAELEALYWARVDSARTRFNEADVHFMTGMVGHHAQALVVAAMVPANGASPAVQTLAARIDNAQRDEIAAMQRWLRDRDQPVPEVHIDGTTLMVHGAGDHHMHMGMPGMLTQAQLDELAATRGEAFDRLFLTYMIQHHGGAVTMVDDLFAADGAAQDGATFKLASDIQVDQRTEIARMQRMLDALPEPAQAP